MENSLVASYVRLHDDTGTPCNDIARHPNWCLRQTSHRPARSVTASVCRHRTTLSLEKRSHTVPIPCLPHTPQTTKLNHLIETTRITMMVSMMYVFPARIGASWGQPSRRPYIQTFSNPQVNGSAAGRCVCVMKLRPPAGRALVV